MAVITNSQVVVPWVEGDIDRKAVVGLRGVTSGDTIDLGAGGYPLFSVVERAVGIGLTVVGAATFTVTGSAVLTVPAGIAADAVMILVYGSAL